MKLNFLLLTGAAIAAALAGSFFLYTPPVADVHVPTYLERVADEAQLPPDSRKEILRRVQYAPDGFTKQRLVVYFTNGDTGVTLFYPDGSLDVYRYHPSKTEIDWKASKLSEKNLKVMLRIAQDGKSVKDERRWNADGRLVRIGLRLPSGGYQVQSFYADGKSSENSLYSVSGILESQSTFWQNGNPKIVLKRPNPGTSDWTSYAENGKKIGWHKVEGSGERGEFFFEDGVSVRMRFSKEYSWSYYSGSSSVSASYYDRSGALVQTRLYRSGSFDVTILKNGSTTGFVQKWRVIDTKRTVDAFAADNVRLDTVVVTKFDGLENVQIGLKDGKVTTVSGDRKLSSGGVESIMRTYRADGTLEKEQVRLTANPKERMFPGDSGGRVSVPDVYLAVPPFEAPPAVPSPSTWSGGY
ncbi:MAG: hypothetical protein SGJ27_29265 [Candidatus Melainabacteria bacterium]|nr:hypothetical protein [Candidatus Melainabacteria bacterium]